MTEEYRKEANARGFAGLELVNEAEQNASQQQPLEHSTVVQETESLSDLDQVSEAVQPPSIEDALKEAVDNRDRWMRAVAELENYKKRTMQERSKLLKYRNEELLRDLLGVLDNMERALEHSRSAGKSDAFTNGVVMITDMLKDLLLRYGVTEIKALGEPFDPHVHEALARIPMANEEPNRVVEVLEKGYLYQDRLLRPAKVGVSAALNIGNLKEKDSE